MWSALQKIPYSIRLSAAIIWGVAIPVLSLLPARFFRQAHELVHFPQASKVVHAIMYAIMTSLLLWVSSVPGRPLRMRSACLAASAAVAYGLLMELLQHFTSSRTMSLWDGLADAVGAFLAVGIALCVARLFGE